MANGLPYFRWYVADAEMDENYSGMTDQELGFYHRCLNKSWTNSGLPTDMDDLASVMKVKRTYLDKVWVKVGRCFSQTDTVRPRFVNPRQEKERTHAITKSSRATDAVRTRYGRRTDEVPRAGARADSGSESGIPVVDLSLAVIDKSYTMDEAFMMFMAEVSLTGTPLIDADYLDAHREWAALDMPRRLLAVSNFREKREAGVFNDPAMVMRPWKWIKRHEFNRRMVKATANGKVPVTDQVKQLAMQRMQRDGQL